MAVDGGFVKKYMRPAKTKKEKLLNRVNLSPSLKGF